MTFVDITVVPVARDSRARYVEFSRRMADVYRERGASRIVDYWQTDGPTDQDDFHADDVHYDAGELSDLAHAVGASATEAVVVSVTEWPSREARDRGVAAATRDPRVSATVDEDPVFDGGRLLAGSFHVAMTSEQTPSSHSSPAPASDD